MKHLQKYQSFLLEQQTTVDLKTAYINKSIPLPNENQTYSLPYKVTCGYRATNRDELHAFQGTKDMSDQKYDVGNMNMIVKKWLDYFYSIGINPQVSKVDITVNGMEVTWTVTITESKDGKAWVGFTSRGSASNESIADENLAKGKKDVTAKFPGCEIEDVYTHSHMPNGRFGFVQHFIKYTNPKMPAHKASETSTQTQPETTTQTTPTGKLLIDESSDDMLNLSNQVKAKQNISIDENTIEVNLDTSPFTFKCGKGETTVYLMKLVWNIPGEEDIPSATKVIEANKENYPNTRILKQGKFENDTRDWAVVGLIK